MVVPLTSVATVQVSATSEVCLSSTTLSTRLNATQLDHKSNPTHSTSLPTYLKHLSQDAHIKDDAFNAINPFFFG